MARRLSELEYGNAVQSARREDLTEPRAQAAHYDRRSGQIVVELKTGAKFLFPCNLAQGLAGAAPDDLDRIEISPSGAGLRWPALDADFNLSELMRGVFGTEAWMRQLRQQTKIVQKPRPSSARIRNRNPHRPSS